MVGRQLGIREKRLDKLYDAIEEGHVSTVDLAPRIRKLKDEVDQLRQRIREIEAWRDQGNLTVSIAPSKLKSYVSDLQALLLEGEYFERRSFLKSFIKRIDLSYPQVSVEYTFPLIPERGISEEVLAIDRLSGPLLTDLEPICQARQQLS